MKMINNAYEIQNLIRYHSADFDKWWPSINKEKLKLKSIIRYLAEWCPYKFDVWYNEKNINYKESSYILATYCSHKFDVWWKNNLLLQNWAYSYRKIDNKTLIQCLFLYCKEHVNKWLNKNKLIYTEHSCYMMVIHLGDYFDLWFDRDLVMFEQYGTQYLLLNDKYLHHFNKWWNPKKLDLNCVNNFSDENMKKFETIYKDYKHIWAKDIVIAKLTN